ncbi:MAG: hypothetical protein Q9190_000559 [Brigantiaea leucoxantha]
MDMARPYIKKFTPPFIHDDSIYAALAESPSLEREPPSPLPGWTFASRGENGHRLPQTIAHRGHKEEYPENTMGAFIGAVKAGAHAVETDVHLTKDGVVVLSHDATLQRCFGKEDKIIDRDWSYIREQQTTRAPHEPMPRLKDLLEYLASPELGSIWLLLDIKVLKIQHTPPSSTKFLTASQIDNNADDIMRLMARTIQDIPPNPHNPWDKRIVLGCWAAKFFPLCAKYLPTFPVCNIGFSGSYARQFLALPNISFNLLQKTMFGPGGKRLLREAKAANRPVYFWTVNEENMMRWSIKNEADGVITDNPKKFLEVCKDWEQGKRDIVIDRGGWVTIVWLNAMVIIFSVIFWWRYGSLKGQQQKQQRKKGEEEDNREVRGTGTSAVESKEDR